MTSVRRLLDDPAYDVWFLKYANYNGSGTFKNPACDYNFSPPKCSHLWHSQTQTPQHKDWAHNASIPPDFGDGMCAEACDCGRVPCGENQSGSRRHKDCPLVLELHSLVSLC